MTQEIRFAPGTFAPHPRAAPPARMLAAQAGLELRLLLRNGEQLLLTMLIPIALLIGIALLPIGAHEATRIAALVPAVMAVALMSTAFTGQAIAVGFDRRYGALKRLGATALPKWGVIAGKSLAVLVVVGLQSLIMGAIGLALGWRPDPAGLLLGVPILLVGVFAFASLGLLLGGTLKAEVVLALANLLWFALAGIGSLVLMHEHIPAAVTAVARITPSGALTEALVRATEDTGMAPLSLVVLLVWGVLGSAAAVRTFKFTG